MPQFINPGLEAFVGVPFQGNQLADDVFNEVRLQSRASALKDILTAQNPAFGSLSEERQRNIANSIARGGNDLVGPAVRAFGGQRQAGGSASMLNFQQKQLDRLNRAGFLRDVLSEQAAGVTGVAGGPLTQQVLNDISDAGLEKQALKELTDENGPSGPIFQKIAQASGEDDRLRVLADSEAIASGATSAVSELDALVPATPPPVTEPVSVASDRATGPEAFVDEPGLRGAVARISQRRPSSIKDLLSGGKKKKEKGVTRLALDVVNASRNNPRIKTPITFKMIREEADRRNVPRKQVVRELAELLGVDTNK